MVLSNLWDNLPVNPSTKANLIKDLSEGKVPQLPYFVIGLEPVKASIKSKIEQIDQGRMITTFLIGKYGNGKTNILKYLELFFSDHPSVKTIYRRANIDQPDLGLFLMKEIQDSFTDQLINAVLELRNDYDFNILTNGYPQQFASIKEYSDTLFDTGKNSDEIKKLIYLGTGRLYTKSHFQEFGIQQLSNYERKEILVLFLNILASVDIYIIFEIDEIEKIYEKSKLRLNAFYTSYRELFDLFSFVKGHYLICSQTDANSDADTLRALNEAFYTRIENDIIQLAHISKDQDILTLVQNLNDLFGTNKSANEIEDVVKNLKKRRLSQNRELFRETSQLLLKNATGGNVWRELLNQHGLDELYEETETELEYGGILNSLSSKFFGPLETYLVGNSFLENSNKLEARDLQSFIDVSNQKVHYFILNESTTLPIIQNKISDIVNRYSFDIIIYSPINLELKNGMIESEVNIEIVDYDPKELFILLNMYRDNFEHQDNLSRIIGEYTSDKL